MLKATWSKLAELRPPVRALLFLYWIYAFAGSLVGIFVQIFLYEKFSDISLNVFATMAFYTGIMLGFCIPGYLASIWQINIKYGFSLSFFMLAVSLLSLLRVEDTRGALWAMLFWGFGQGIYWLTVNTFELSETKSGEREFYSSVLNAGNQILSLVGPASATFFIWISGTVLHWGTFTILFIVAPAIYLFGFFCFGNIRDYRPHSISGSDIKHFFTDRKNQYAQLFTAGTGFQQALGVTVPPLVLLLILGTALRVGVYDTFFAVFSAICLIAVAQYRTSENRLKIYGFTTAGIALITSALGYIFNFGALIAYTILQGILSPINNVSSHVTDLDSMEIGKEGSDFYATMILRDVYLWIWRMIGAVIFLIIISYITDERQALSVGMYLVAVGFILTYIGAYLFIKKMREKLS